MRIVVTDRDIIQAAVDKAAGHGDAYCCPVAQSLKRRGFQCVTVGNKTIVWTVSGRTHTIPTPPVAAEWIEKYDDHHHVGPFSFELEVTV